MKLLFFDIETTGFSRQFDYIIELAGIIYDTETGEELDVFHEYIKPNKKIPINITEITGITNEQVEDCRNEKDVVYSFIQFVEKHAPSQYVGHNIDAFDILWLKEKSMFYGFSFPNYTTIDTLKVARELKAPTSKFTATGRPSYSQESIAGGFGIVYDAHSAIADVQALIEIFKRLHKGKPIEEKQKPIDKYRKKLGF